MEKCGIDEQATDDNIIRPTHIVCWLTKATDTYPEYVILNVFHCNNGCSNVTQCCVTRTSPIWLVHESKTQIQCMITCYRKQEDNNVTELCTNPDGKKGINLSNVADLISS